MELPLGSRIGVGNRDMVDLLDSGPSHLPEGNLAWACTVVVGASAVEPVRSRWRDRRAEARRVGRTGEGGDRLEPSPDMVGQRHLLPHPNPFPS